MDTICSLIGFGFMILFAFFHRPIFAAITILIGDKQGLHEFGNLCDDPENPDPKKSGYWTSKEILGKDEIDWRDPWQIPKKGEKNDTH